MLWGLSNGFHFVSVHTSRLLGYEGLEVINPEGGKEDAEEEAHRGRWKEEVGYLLMLYSLILRGTDAAFTLKSRILDTSILQHFSCFLIYTE